MANPAVVPQTPKAQRIAAARAQLNPDPVGKYNQMVDIEDEPGNGNDGTYPEGRADTRARIPSRQRPVAEQR